MRGVDKLNVTQDKLIKSCQLLPAALLEPLVELKLQALPTSRKKAVIRREATKRQESI